MSIQTLYFFQEVFVQVKISTFLAEVLQLLKYIQKLLAVLDDDIEWEIDTVPNKAL